MNRDERQGELEPIDAELARLLEPAQTVEPVEPSHRRALRRRLEAEVGPLDASHGAQRPWFGWVAVAVVAAASLVVWLMASGPTDVAGRVTVKSERVTVATGERATVVAEPETQLRWVVLNGDAVVEQDSGRAFYRVESGGDYLVRTPHAEARVTGTSFEVEIVMPKNKQRLKHMGLGAAISAATVVTVYEGRVVLANDEGTAVLAAGQRAVASQGQAPSSPRSRFDVDGTDAPAAMPSAAPGDSILVSDLRSRVRELEHELAEARERGDRDEDEDEDEDETGFIRAIYDPTPEELADAADNCAIGYAVPTKGQGAHYLAPEQAEELGVSPEELERITTALDREQTQWVQRLRGLYVEATGDEDGAQSLSEEAMRAELLDKTTDDQRKEARVALARERAGRAETVAGDDSAPVARYYRAELARTRRVFDALVEVAGDERRAYEMLAKMPMNMTTYNGCDD